MNRDWGMEAQRVDRPPSHLAEQPRAGHSEA